MATLRKGFMVYPYQNGIYVSCDNKVCETIDDVRMSGPSDAWPDINDLILYAEKHDKDLHPICPECQQGKHQNCDGCGNIDENGKSIACFCTDKSEFRSVHHP